MVYTWLMVASAVVFAEALVKIGAKRQNWGLCPAKAEVMDSFPYMSVQQINHILYISMLGIS